MKKNKWYRHLLYYLLIGSRAFFMLLPYRWGFSFGGTLGRITFHILPKEKRKTLAHLRTAFGSEKSEKELAKLGEKVFEHYGKTMAELGLVDKILPRINEFAISTGYENVHEALGKGKGVIVIIAHFGNWELMGGYSGLVEKMSCNVIARRIYFEPYDRLLNELRRKMRMNVIYRDSSPKQVLSILKRNEILCMVVDQDVDTVEGVFVNFFGKPAYTPAAPVRFSMVTGAPILISYAVRDGLKHHITVTPPIELVNTGNKEEDIRTNTQKWVSLQEEFIRKNPDQWVWNHKRWKTVQSSR